MSALGLVLASVLLSAAPQATQDQGRPPFQHVRYPALDGSSFRNLATGDLDSDGDADLAVCRGSDLLLMWGSGGGWIERTERLAVPSDAAAVGDLDGDADADLVTVGGGEAHILLGDGQGGFSPPVSLRLGAAPSDVLLSDLDADGDLDAVVVCEGTVRTLLGDGQGGFPVGRSAGLSGESWRGALGDLDEDGWLDLVVDPGQQLFLGDGQGGFVPAGALNVTSGYGGPCLADFDGDGHLDLLTCDSNYALVLLLGDGAGGFPSSQVQPLPFPPYSLGSGDLDGDGSIDAVAKSIHGHELGVFLNDGTGNLAQRGTLPWVGMAVGSNELQLVDLDGNGALDLVSASYRDVMLLPGDGAGWFLLPDELPGVSAAHAELADLDGDGAADVACAAGGLTTFLGDGQGGFAAPLVGPAPSSSKLALGDLDGDGLVDLATSLDDAALTCRGDGTGRFPYVTRHLQGSYPRSPALADLDGDGHADLVFACGSSWWRPGVGLLLGNGSGGFVEHWFPTAPPAYDDLTVGHVDGDGALDIVAVNPGRLDVLRGDGQGGFGPPTSYALPQEIGCVALVDLDQDGPRDVIVGSTWQAGVWVLWGQGGGVLGTPELIADSASIVHPRDLEVADVDGDAVPELLVAYEGYSHQETPGGLAVLRRVGPRELRWTWTFGHGYGPWSLASGDLDRDGRLDLVVGSLQVSYPGPRTVAGPVSVLLNQLPAEPACTGEVRYCVAKVNSAGCLPRICSDGSPSISGPDDFVVRAERVLSHQPGLLIWGLTSATQTFQGGTLCIAAPLTRTSPQSAGGTPGANDCSGTYAFAFGQAYMASHGLTAGTLVYAQVWSRDAYLPAPVAVGLTDALSFTIAP